MVRFNKFIYEMLMLVVFVMGQPLAAQDVVSGHKSKRDRLEKEIVLLDRQLEGINSKSRSALAELTVINKKISVRKEMIGDRERQIATYSSQIRVAEREMKTLQTNLDTLQAYYTRLVRSAYKNRDVKIWYMYILASDNIGQAFRRYSYFKNLSSQMKDQADHIRDMQKEVEVRRKALEGMRKKETEEKSKLTTELASLGSEQQKADKTVKDLQRNKSKYQRDIAAKKQQVTALNREIERIIANAMKGTGKSATGTAKPKAPIDYKLAEEFSKNKGKLPWPAEGSVIDHYGVRYHPVYKSLKMPSNDGVTIALESGSPVKAVFDGVVKQIAVMPGYNKCILVQHGNYFSLYCKMGLCNVKAGDKVKTGDVLGTIDTMNGETQLHFQIWKGQSTQNPELWLRPMY